MGNLKTDYSRYSRAVFALREIENTIGSLSESNVISTEFKRELSVAARVIRLASSAMLDLHIEETEKQPADLRLWLREIARALDD